MTEDDSHQSLHAEMTDDKGDVSMLAQMGDSSGNASVGSGQSGRYAEWHSNRDDAYRPQAGPSGAAPTHPAPMTGSTHDTDDGYLASSSNDTTTDHNNNTSKSFLDMTFSAIARRFKSSQKDGTPPPPNDPPVMPMAHPNTPVQSSDGSKTPKNPRLPSGPKAVITRSDVKKGRIFAPEASSTPSRPTP